MKYGKLENNILVPFEPIKHGLLLNNYIIYNPTKEQYIEAGWFPIEEISNDGQDYIEDNILYHYIGYNNALNNAINKKLKEIEDYDISDNVNVFYLGEMPLWIPRETRVSLQNSTAILLKNNITTATLWHKTMHFDLSGELLLHLLDELEIYALQCFNKTAEHKANVMQLTTIEDVENYNYTVGYPEKLTFTL